MIFGLIALYTGWRAVARAGARELPSRSEFARQWLWIGVTVLTLALATRIQIVTLSVAAGWGMCVAIAAAADALVRGAMTTWKRSVPMQVTILGLVLAGTVMVFEGDMISRLVRNSQNVPEWAQTIGPGSRGRYAKGLFWAFPTVIALAPVSFLVLALRRPRLGVYLLTWFAVPFLLHTFVFPWKAARFILLAVPALLAASAISASMGATELRAWTQHTLAEWRLSGRTRNALTTAAIGTVSLVLISTMPALYQAWSIVQTSGTERWRQTAVLLQSRPDLREVPLGATASLHSLYYLGRVDFVTPHDSRSRGAVAGGTSVGSYQRDFKTDVPILSTPAAIRTHFADKGAVLIGIDSAFVTTERIRPELRKTLQRDAIELCQGKCGSEMLFLWEIQPDSLDGT